MRTYGKNWRWKKIATYKQRQNRVATEWDVRLDVCAELPVEDIVNRVKESLDGFLYVLVSGVEHPDIQPTHGCSTKEQLGPWNNGKNQYGSAGDHVHLCVVLLEPKQRQDVLRMLRGPRKMSDEYCTPRNPKFTYAGWVIHHSKSDWKIDGEPDVRFEHGTLPLDPITTDTAVEIKRILDKFGSDVMKRRFKAYTDMISKNKIMEKIERLQMQLNDEDATDIDSQ